MSTSTTVGDGSIGPSASHHLHPDRIVASYLKSRGYRGAEALLLQEAKLPPPTLAATAAVSSLTTPASVPDYLLYYNEAEASDPSAYATSYSSLAEWVEGCLEVYHRELESLLYPCFVHGYLDLVGRNLAVHAKAFWDAASPAHAEWHGEEVQRLLGITSPDILERSEWAQSWLKTKYVVKMSKYAFELVLSFLQDYSCMLLLSVINQHISIQILTSKYESHQTPGLVGVPGATSTAPPTTNLEAFNAQAVKLGALPPDVVFLSSMEKVLMRDPSLVTDTMGSNELEMVLNHIKQLKEEAAALEASDTSPSREAIPLPVRKLIDIPTELEAMNQLRHRISLSRTTLPSICCYTFHNAQQSLTCIRASADATLLCTGSENSVIKLYDMTAAMSTSPTDDKNVVSSSVGNLGIGPCGKLVGHSDTVYAMDFSPDNKYLVSCSADQTARLWSLDTFTNLMVYKGHYFPIWDVAFGPFGHYFATASHDRTARLWSCDHATPLRIFSGHLGDVECLAWHPNGAYLLTGSSDHTARLWDIQKGSCVRLLCGHDDPVTQVAISPDGLTAVTVSGTALHLFDLGTGRSLQRLKHAHEGPIYTLTFSGDGHILASGGGDDTVRIWDAKKAGGRESFAINGKGDGDNVLLATFPTKRTPIFNLQFTRNNLLLAMGSFVVEDAV